MTVTGSGERVYISEDTVISNADITTSNVIMESNGPLIEIVFTKFGAEKIAGQRAIISGNFSEEVAKRIAHSISH